ncbi:hypothetical protein quinque_001371 [Culex quinquefasciatus]
MILYLLLSILVLSFLWIQRQYSYWERRGVPYVKASFPRGNLQGVGKKFHMSTAIQACYNKLKGKGPFGGIFFFLNPVVLVTDLELVKHVLVKDFQFFHDRSLYYNEKDDPLTGNLLNIEEALRKYPPGPSLSRAVTKNYKVPNTNTMLEMGTSVLIPVYAIHHDPEYFPEPERYDPDRFLLSSRPPDNPYSYLPFGEGPRDCIGLRFGLTVAPNQGMAYVLKGFRISLSRRTPVPLELSRQKMILTIEGDCGFIWRALGIKSIILNK